MVQKVHICKKEYFDQLLDFQILLLLCLHTLLLCHILLFGCCIFSIPSARLGMSVTTQGGSGRQYVTGSRRNLSKYRFVLLNVYRFRET